MRTHPAVLSRPLSVFWGAVATVFLLVAGTGTRNTLAQVTATARSGATPAWNKGILPVNSESYYHAIECGKQGGEDPPCVFWDTGLCQNDDFVLTAYSGYKQVAYSVWDTVRRGQPAPQPDYQGAQRTRVTIGVTPVPGASNTLTDLILTRGGEAVTPVDRHVSGGRFTWDYPAWAPTSSITLEMVGEARTISCAIPAPVLRQFR